MIAKIEGIDKLDKLIPKVELQIKYLNNLNGQEFDLKNTPFIAEDSYLHSTEESAKFEAENKKVFDFLRGLETIFRDIVK